MNTATPADSAVVAAARAGDREAWRVLYTRYARLVHGVVLAGLPAAVVADGEDLTQEVFMRAMRRVGDLRDDGAVGAWLAGIARHAAASHRRSRARWVLRIAGWGGGSRTGEMEPDAHTRAIRVLGLIRDLPEAYHEPLVLRLVEGLTGPEIAASLGMTEGSVRVNLCRGMKLLREKLGPEEGA